MRERAFAFVRSTIEEMNEELEYETLNEVTEETPIFGDHDGIDSLSLVLLVATLEQEVARMFGRRVVLSDEKAMSMRSSPYRTAGSLADLVVQRLAEVA